MNRLFKPIGVRLCAIYFGSYGMLPITMIVYAFVNSAIIGEEFSFSLWMAGFFSLWLLINFFIIFVGFKLWQMSETGRKIASMFFVIFSYSALRKILVVDSSLDISGDGIVILFGGLSTICLIYLNLPITKNLFKKSS